MFRAIFAVPILGVVTALLSCAPFGIAFGRDLGQWGNTDPDVKAWFRSLKMPDDPLVSCCGEADGYYCDDLHVRADQAYCTVSDDRDDKKLKRAHVPIGAQIPIPPNKLGNYPGNPTGHSIVFIQINGFAPETYSVYCYVQGSGI